MTVLEGQSQFRNFAMDMDGRLQIDAETPGLGGIMGQVAWASRSLAPSRRPQHAGFSDQFGDQLCYCRWPVHFSTTSSSAGSTTGSAHAGGTQEAAPVQGAENS